MQEEVYPDKELLSYLNEKFETGRLDIDVRTDTQLSHRGWHKKGTSDDGHERTGSIPDLHGADVG